MNVLGMLNLADICLQHNIHLTTYATGCIFHYDKDFPENSGKGFKEDDTPNFTGSYYSYTKVPARAEPVPAVSCPARCRWLLEGAVGLKRESRAWHSCHFLSHGGLLKDTVGLK